MSSVHHPLFWTLLCLHIILLDIAKFENEVDIVYCHAKNNNSVDVCIFFWDLRKKYVVHHCTISNIEMCTHYHCSLKADVQNVSAGHGSILRQQQVFEIFFGLPRNFNL